MHQGVAALDDENLLMMRAGEARQIIARQQGDDDGDQPSGHACRHERGAQARGGHRSSCWRSRRRGSRPRSEAHRFARFEQIDTGWLRPQHGANLHAARGRVGQQAARRRGCVPWNQCKIIDEVPREKIDVVRLPLVARMS